MKLDERIASGPAINAAAQTSRTLASIQAGVTHVFYACKTGTDHTANTLSRIADHKINRLDELLSWRYAATTGAVDNRA